MAEEKGKGKKDCFATVVADNGERYDGKYNGIHAEIMALENYLESGGRLGDIARIEISSQPCKYCHLILSDLGLRGLVHVEDDDREFGSCQGGSFGWFYAEGSVWAAIKKAMRGTPYTDQKKYINSVIERQRKL